jgi:Recombinase
MRGVTVTREERTKRLHRDRARARDAGRRVGGSPPYGWRAHRGQLVPVPDEQWRRELVLHLARNGYSLQKIADQLAALQIRPRTGRAWSKATLRGIVLRAVSSCPACSAGGTQHELSCAHAAEVAVS